MEDKKPELNKPLLGSRWGEGMWVLGIFLVSLGVSLCSKADLGVSMIAAPAFIIQEALAPHLPWLTVGVTEYVYQGIVLIIMCIIVRRFDIRYLGAFLVAVIYGYVLDMWLAVIGVETDVVYFRWLLMAAGAVTTAVGVTCFFRTYLPLEVYELVVAEVAKRYSYKLEKTKIGIRSDTADRYCGFGIDDIRSYRIRLVRNIYESIPFFRSRHSIYDRCQYPDNYFDGKGGRQAVRV